MPSRLHLHAPVAPAPVRADSPAAIASLSRYVPAQGLRRAGGPGEHARGAVRVRGPRHRAPRLGAAGRPGGGYTPTATGAACCASRTSAMCWWRCTPSASGCIDLEHGDRWPRGAPDVRGRCVVRGGGQGREGAAITFVGLLSFCSHAGLVDQGMRSIDSMKEAYGYYSKLLNFQRLKVMKDKVKPIEEVFFPSVLTYLLLALGKQCEESIDVISVHDLV
jgi:hypothetical protein